MQKGILKYVLPAIFSIILLLSACGKDKPQPVIIKPDPESWVLYKCPERGDIYKLIVDTIIINAKSELFTTYGSMIPYAYSAIPLGACDETAGLYGTAKYSPLSARVKTDKGETRDMIWDRNGYFKDVILPEDIQRIRTFQSGEKAVFQLSLLNFNKDVIQTSRIVIIYKEKYSGE